MPGGSAWVEQQVPGGHLVQLDRSGEACRELPRIARADNGVTRALNKQRRRAYTSSRLTRADRQSPEVCQARRWQAHSSPKLMADRGRVQVEVRCHASDGLAQIGLREVPF